MTDLSSYKANLENYLTSVSILKTMQKRDILSNNDYKTAEENLCEIIVSISHLYTESWLIFLPTRV